MAADAQALYSNTTGQNNISVGFQAGFNLTTGSNNIEVGNAGGSGEANTIRIGTQGMQTGAYIAGISGTAVTGSDVIIISAGQLGIVAGTARIR